MSEQRHPEASTRRWVENVIVGLNFCPFARKELLQNTIRFAVTDVTDLEGALQQLAAEWRHLDEEGGVETTLLIFAEGFRDFEDFLQLIDFGEELLSLQGYEGTYQLAHFHPDYCFADADADDAANYTNRSPYPMLHIIREKSMAMVLDSYPDPESIPERNIELARGKGIEAMRQLLRHCIGDA